MYAYIKAAVLTSNETKQHSAWNLLILNSYLCRGVIHHHHISWLLLDGIHMSEVYITSQVKNNFIKEPMLKIIQSLLKSICYMIGIFS